MKGKEKRKGKEKETCSRASTNNLALILMRVISFGVPEDDLYVFQPLKRISTVDLLSWLLYNKNWLQETGRHLSPVGITAQNAALQNHRSLINNKTGKEIALGQVFNGIVEGRKSPMHDLYRATDRKYWAKLSVNVSIRTIFCMVSSD